MRVFIFVMLFICHCTMLCAEPLRVGTTYSPRQSEYLDMDWRETYLAVLDEGFDIIRLGAYWDEIEKSENIYDFSSLDWQLKEAREKEIPVVLTVGMKAPRWPEYFIPEWVLEKTSLPFGADVSKSEFLRERTLKFIKKVVEHCKEDPTIHYWQVENEPMDRMGEQYWFIGEAFLRQEVELVRSLGEANRPILLTSATYPNKTLRFIARLFLWHDPVKESLAICDIIGLNVYPVVGREFWFGNVYFRGDRKESGAYFSNLLAAIEKGGKKVWLTELQAEPWEPGQLVYMEKARPLSGDPELAMEVLREFQELGVNTVLLWGAEYWRYRAQNYGDTQWQDTVRDILKNKAN
ncbi:MAG: beta-galactosidase [Candidatus Omnitrophota bacterium]